MRVEVRYFASLTEKTRLSCESIEVDPSIDVHELWRQLIERHPQLATIAYRPMVACDREYSQWTRNLSGVREVAFLPPVSGG
jgi:molybdopterin converting factor subunit 1